MKTEISSKHAKKIDEIAIDNTRGLIREDLLLGWI